MKLIPFSRSACCLPLFCFAPLPSGTSSSRFLGCRSPRKHLPRRQTSSNAFRFRGRSYKCRPVLFAFQFRHRMSLSPPSRSPSRTPRPLRDHHDIRHHLYQHAAILPDLGSGEDLEGSPGHLRALSILLGGYAFPDGQ